MGMFKKGLYKFLGLFSDRYNANVAWTGKPPANRFGVFAVHCSDIDRAKQQRLNGEPVTFDETPFSADDMRRMIEGPIAAMEPKLQAELARPAMASEGMLG